MKEGLFKDVCDFHAKFALPRTGDGELPGFLSDDDFSFRLRFLEEEMQELNVAFFSGKLEGVADALCDLVYVALGTAALFRFPFDECWAEVQRANMAKERATSASDPRSTRKHHLDVVKPPGWLPPDVAGAIERYREAIVRLVPRYDPRSNSAAMRTDWDKRFLDLARHVAGWSKDPSTKCGAVLVGSDRREIAHGYNGFPPGIADDGRLSDRTTKYKLIQHAERNVLDNATFSADGSTLYCTLPPCINCAKSIITKRVARVVTPPHPPIEEGRWTVEIPDAQLMLSEAGVATTIR